MIKGLQELQDTGQFNPTGTNTTASLDAVMYALSLLGDPDTANRATLQLLLKSGVTYTSAAKLIAGSFLAREFGGGRVHGVVVYHVYGSRNSNRTN